MKKMTITWTIILVLIVAGLTVFGFSIKDKEIDNLMEKELVKQAEKYLGLYTKEFPKLGQKKKITYDKLKTDGYDAKLEDGCTGYVIIENTNMGFQYKGFVKCPNYTTEGYEND